MNLYDEKIKIISQNWNEFEVFVSFQGLKVYIWWIDYNISEWDKIIRTITENNVKNFNIIDVKYHKLRTLSHTELKVEKEWKKDNSLKHISIWTINNNGNFALENYWSQNITNQIDDILEILNKKELEADNELKDVIIELKTLIKDFKENQNKSSLEKVISIIWNSSSAWSLLVAIIWLLTNS